MKESGSQMVVSSNVIVECCFDVFYRLKSYQMIMTMGQNILLEVQKDGY
jgi:hypothetical protein